MGGALRLKIPTQILEKISFLSKTWKFWLEPSSRPCYGDTGFTRNSDTDFGKDKLFKKFPRHKTSKIIFSFLFDTDFGKDKLHFTFQHSARSAQSLHRHESAHKGLHHKY